jgi:hypothetical protein
MALNKKHCGNILRLAIQRMLEIAIASDIYLAPHVANTKPEVK